MASGSGRDLYSSGRQMGHEDGRSHSELLAEIPKDWLSPGMAMSIEGQGRRRRTDDTMLQ